MEFKQLLYFTKVAELGSFTRAAEILHVSQPVLSRHVRQLEVELRQNLLLRNGRGVTTTEAGELLLEHSRGILHQVERAQEEMGRIKGRLAGRVTVGLPPSLARLMALRLTREFKIRLPKARLSISEGLSATMTEWLRAGRLDIALVHNTLPSSEFTITPLGVEPLYVVSAKTAAPKTSAIDYALLAKLPLILPNHPHAIRSLLEAQLSKQGLEPTITLEIDGIPAILDLVADGAGHALLTRHAVDTSMQPSSYSMSPIAAPGFSSQLFMATTSGRATTLTQQAVMELIREISAEVFANS